MRLPGFLALLLTLLLVRECSTTGRGLGLYEPPAMDVEPNETVARHEALTATDDDDGVDAGMGQAPGPGIGSDQAQAPAVSASGMPQPRPGYGIASNGNPAVVVDSNNPTDSEGDSEEGDGGEEDTPSLVPAFESLAGDEEEEEEEEEDEEEEDEGRMRGERTRRGRWGSPKRPRAKTEGRTRTQYSIFQTLPSSLICRSSMLRPLSPRPWTREGTLRMGAPLLGPPRVPARTPMKLTSFNRRRPRRGLNLRCPHRQPILFWKPRSACLRQAPDLGSLLMVPPWVPWVPLRRSPYLRLLLRDLPGKPLCGARHHPRPLRRPGLPGPHHPREHKTCSLRRPWTVPSGPSECPTFLH
eukprot:jgi/Botrbrau1/16110/Bobra.7_2s0074.1